jgi:hypothetical protein
LQDVEIRLSAIWVALMLTYLLGDVLRISPVTSSLVRSPPT